MELLGPLPKTKTCNQHVFLITDRYSKLEMELPLQHSTEGLVNQAFFEYLVMPYVIPKSINGDKGLQFVSKFFVSMWRIMGI